jgi:hypothetical protein
MIVNPTGIKTVELLVIDVIIGSNMASVITKEVAVEAAASI